MRREAIELSADPRISMAHVLTVLGFENANEGRDLDTEGSRGEVHQERGACC